MGQNFRTQEHLNTWTGVVLGQTIHENFQNISPRRGNLRGYLEAVEIIVSGSFTQSAATAVLEKEILWDILSAITLKGHLHEWCSSLPGWQITVAEVFDETISLQQADDIVTADFANDQLEHTFLHSYLLPMDPKNFQLNRIGKGEYDGCFPLAAMGSNGSLDMTVRNTGFGDWALTSGSTLTIKVILHEWWTEKVIIPAPWEMRSITDTNSDVDMPGQYGAIDMLFMTDNVPSTAVTLPTGNVRLKVDGDTIYDDMTGAMLEFAVNRSGRNDSIDDLVDEGVVPLRWPQESQSMFDSPTGRQVIISDCGVAHVAASGTPRYTIRRYLPADTQQLVEWPKALGRKFNPKTQRGQLAISGKRAGRGVPSDPAKIAGANMQVE